eukprot:NODE_146_length_17563_cov_0.253321.p1 type:complete len:1153 gc:universal NODE_146_length_17563_cov_0.253321:8691-5233(-)
MAAAPRLCKMKGYCGPFLSKGIPCANDTTPDIPKDELKAEIMEFCPSTFNSEAVCCTSNQFDDLKRNFKIVNLFAGNCPACVQNFKTLFCEITCGDQAIFNITETGEGKNGKIVVAANLSINNQFGEGLYNSCKDVKLSASGTNVLDFIGGAAKDWVDLAKFLGTKRPMGSPFTFVPVNISTGLNSTVVPCNDPTYKCPCLDCPDVCPDISDIQYTNIPLFNQIWMISVISTSVLLFFLYALFKLFKRRRSFQTPLLSTADDYNEDDLISSNKSLHHTSTPSTSVVYNANISTPAWYYLSRLSGNIGFYSTLYRRKLLFVMALYFILLSIIISLVTIKFETDPVLLWSSPSSNSRISKSKFDSTFGRFYRIQQAILTSKDSVITHDNVIKIAELVETISSMTVEVDNKTWHFNDLCLEINSNCVIYSIYGYYHNQLDKVNSIQWNSTLSCLLHPTDIKCLPLFLQPLQPSMVLADYKKDSLFDSRGLLVTIPMRHIPTISEKFELKLLTLFANISMDTPLIYSVESSIELEVNKATSMDFIAIFISYICMFIYILFTLNTTTVTGSSAVGNVLNRIRYSWYIVLLGLMLITSSLTTTFIIMHIMGIKPSFILLEVLPFLILAIGVDNLFLINKQRINYTNMNTSQNQPFTDNIPMEWSSIMSSIGPSIITTTLLESVSFLLAMLMDTPAITVFCLYASVALIINMIAQLIFLPAVFTLDKPSNVYTIPEENTPVDPSSTVMGKLVIILLKHSKVIKYFIALLLVVSVTLQMTIPMGLNQVDVLPSNSYLKDYYHYIDKLVIGAPVYYTGYDVKLNSDSILYLCGRSPICKENNMVSLLSVATKSSTTAPIDDFMSWLDPELGCCGGHAGSKEDMDRGYHLPTRDELCKPDTFFGDCVPCFNKHVPIHDKDYVPFLRLWLNSSTGDTCLNSGQAYQNDVNIRDYDDDNSPVSISYRTWHESISSQYEFIQALQLDEDINRYLSSKLPFDVGIYSPFHVFFEQYLGLKWRLTYVMLLVVLLTLFISILLLGSLKSGLIIVVLQIMVSSCVMNFSHLLGLELNSLLAANLIMSMGITFEFTSHLMIKYLKNQGSIENRIVNCYVDVGNTILTGIAATKFVGVMALSLASSIVFQKYYFIFYFLFVVVVVFAGSLN